MDGDASGGANAAHAAAQPDAHGDCAGAYQRRKHMHGDRHLDGYYNEHALAFNSDADCYRDLHKHANRCSYSGTDGDAFYRGRDATAGRPLL